MEGLIKNAEPGMLIVIHYHIYIWMKFLENIFIIQALFTYEILIYCGHDIEKNIGFKCDLKKM